MKEELNNLLLELLNEIKTGKDFLKGELPEVAKEILLVGRVNEVLGLIGGLLFCFVSLGFSIWLYFNHQINDVVLFCLAFFSAIFFIFGLIVISGFNIKPFIAPKYYIVSKIKDLME